MENIGNLRQALLQFVAKKFQSRPQICQLAEDIVQQAFVAVPADKWNFGYLSTACVHIAYRQFKRLDSGPEVPCGDDLLLCFLDSGDVAEEIIRADDTKAILDSLQALKEIERTIVTQRYFGDYSFAQIARSCKMNLNTVLSHHRRALERLKPRLSQFAEGRVKKSRPIRREVFMMTADKKLMQFGVCAERIHRLAMDLAIQSVNLGNYGKGIAVVADECRYIGNQMLHLYYEAGSFDKIERGTLQNLQTELQTLAVNGMIESMQAADREADALRAHPHTVLFNELDGIVRQLDELFGDGVAPAPVWPVVSPKDKVICTKLPYLQMTCGGRDFSENLRFVREIAWGPGLGSESGQQSITLRGVEIPVLAVGKIPGVERAKTVFYVIVKTAYEEKCRLAALPVDHLPYIFWSYPGVGRAEKEEFLRASWPCEEEKSMDFLDYCQLL